ncbi:MAG: hypothetical protein E7E96_05575 [Enterococcus faecalis]|nr:hypothetical protein [Enterococcus faecalis]
MCSCFTVKHCNSRRLTVFERGAKIQSDFCPTLFFFYLTFNHWIKKIIRSPFHHRHIRNS